MTDAVLGTIPFERAVPRVYERAGAPDVGPVQPRERINLLDVLRGFALLGILQVNWSDWNADVSSFLGFLIDDKMRTIYSFLFGLGFSIQMMRAEEKGRPFVARYFWRSLLLFFIGAFHFAFIWTGDIIREYALMSVTLLVVGRWHPRVILALAAFALALGVVPGDRLPARGVGGGTFLMRENLDRSEQAAVDLLNRGEMGFVANNKSNHWEAGGSYWLKVQGGLALLRRELRELDIYRWIGGQLMCLFLLGLYAGRRRIFHEPEKHTRLFIGLVAVGLPLGLLANVYMTFGDWVQAHRWPQLSSIFPRVAGRILYDFGNAFLTAGYIGTISLLFLHRARIQQAMQFVLAPVGRMGLTNYLMQSIIVVTLGRLGLYDRFSGWVLLGLLNIIFVVQVAYSRWWLARFQYGPVEWAWRSLTWFTLQPMRSGASSPAEVVAG